MKSTLDTVEEIKKHGYHLDIGEVISQTFENYKKIALLTGGIILLLTVIFFVAAVGIGGILGLAMSFTDFMTEFNVANIGPVGLLVNMAISVVTYSLLAPISAGLIQIAHQAETSRDFDFSTAFVHYKTRHFKDLFLASFLINLISSGIATMLQITNLYFLDETLLFVIPIVSFIISIVILILSLLTIPFIIFGNLNAMNAIRSSIAIASKRFWIILLLLIIFVICAMLGIFALCIGIFFTFPIYFSAQYIIYRNAIPLEEKDELDEIGSADF